MLEYGFSQTRILPHKVRIKDSGLIRENTGQWKPIFFHILRSEKRRDMLKKIKKTLVYLLYSEKLNL